MRAGCGPRTRARDVWRREAQPPTPSHTRQGYFSTLGMAALWPVRNLQQRSTGRWYANLLTPKPEAVGEAEFIASMAPVAFVLAWPLLLVLAGQVSPVHGFMLWLYPWATCGAIWTVMTQARALSRHEPHTERAAPRLPALTRLRCPQAPLSLS